MRDVIGKVAPIGFARVASGAALGGEHLEETFELALRFCGSPHADPYLLSFVGEIVCVISRGSGVTKVTSANMIP